MTEELLTLAEVREYLRLSDSTIRRMLKDGRLTGVLIAGRWRVPKAVVEELATVRLPVIVVEAGDRSIHPVEKLTLELSGDRQAMLRQAMTAVAARGYRVLRDAEGGCCEYMPRAAEDGGDHIIVTVWPEEDQGCE